MNIHRKLCAMLVALLVAVSPVAHSAQAAQPVSIVLVHGVLIDGSSWRGVYDVLARRGFRVTVVQQPLTGFDDDVAATKRAIDQQEGSVVLVGHSYGGAIITVAGTDPNVKALVYVAGLQPDVGETAGEVAPPKPPADKHLAPSKDGFVFMDPAHFAEDVAADLPKAQADFMAHAQMPVAGAAFSVKMPAAAWHDKPSYAVIATQDRALDMQRAKWMATRAGSRVTFINASHAVLISQPRVVAGVIEAAARSVQ